MHDSAPGGCDEGPYRFGVFDFDAATLELRKNSRPVRIRPQSLKLLALLVAHPRELITREQIQQALWGSDTFVDYEQGVNHSIKELRAALGDSPGSPRFIETLPRRGYRFIAPVEKCAPEPIGALALPVEPIPTTTSATSSELPGAIAPGRPRLHTATAAAAFLALVGAAVWGLTSIGRGGTSLSVPATLSVRPFATTGVDAALGVGLANVLSPPLGAQHRMAVDSGARSNGVAPAAAPGLLLEGEISKTGESVTAVVRLRNPATGESVWSDRFQVRADQLFSIENVVAERIIDALNLQLAAAEQQRLRRRYTSNAAAYEDYLRGRAALTLYTPEGTQQAVKAFEATLQRDRSFALARAGLAMAYADMCLRFAPADDVERWGLLAEEEARTALELDPNLAEAHLARAAVARKREFDWGVVMVASERALVLNPNLPQAHFFRAAALYHLGYMDDALIELGKGRKLRGRDLVEPIRTEGLVALFSGNFAPARAHLEEVSRLSSQAIGDVYLALAHYYSGSAERAESMLTSLAVHKSASTASRAGAALAGLLASRGDVEKARDEIGRVLARQYRDHHVAYSLGVAYAQLRQFDEARRWARTAIDTGFPCPVFYERDPLLEPLRQRPGFDEVLLHARQRRDSSAATTGR
jgi:DNA-binding winged helix-turn-helix (wHTH) protein/tetratricopeptide (TPR) repeat protein